MRIIIAVIAAGFVAGCASPGPTVTPAESGGNRADGIVTMSSTTTIFNAVGPDWQVADAGAGDRCRRWGYERASSFTGSQDRCVGYDRHGRCVQTVTTRFYECEG
jgi:hypothetical protein